MESYRGYFLINRVISRPEACDEYVGLQVYDVKNVIEDRSYNVTNSMIVTALLGRVTEHYKEFVVSAFRQGIRSVLYGELRIIDDGEPHLWVEQFPQGTHLKPNRYGMLVDPVTGDESLCKFFSKTADDIYIGIYSYGRPDVAWGDEVTLVSAREAWGHFIQSTQFQYCEEDYSIVRRESNIEALNHAFSLEL